MTRGVKVDDLSTFDIEYLFLNIRGKSVGEDIEVLITCPDDGMTQVPTLINLDDIRVQISPEHTRDIKLDEQLSLRMKYPSNVEDSSVTVNDTFELICGCVEQIYTEEESWSASEYTKKELLDFLEQLSSKQFKEIEKFFETMPKLSHTITVNNPKTGVESDVILEGLTSFFG